MRTLKPARPDMAKAAQSLGRLQSIQDATLEPSDIGLHGANLQVRDLQGLLFEKARFNGAQIDDHAKKTITHLRPFWAEIFANGSVPVPLDDSDRPAHWPPEELVWKDFDKQWCAWQANLQAE